MNNTDKCQNESESTSQIITSDANIPSCSSTHAADVKTKTRKRRLADVKTGLPGLPVIKLKCVEEDFDPLKHTAGWQNNSEFRLVVKKGSVKKCRGCSETFEENDGSLTSAFVIKHLENQAFVNRKMNTLDEKSDVPSYYHVSASCIAPRHPFFKPAKIKCDGKTKRQLTKDNIEQFKSFGISLFHLEADAATSSQF